MLVTSSETASLISTNSGLGRIRNKGAFTLDTYQNTFSTATARGYYLADFFLVMVVRGVTSQLEERTGIDPGKGGGGAGGEVERVGVGGGEKEEDERFIRVKLNKIHKNI